MGLTIHYELRLPTSTSDGDVDRIVAALHDYAQTLPFENVSPVSSLADAPSDPNEDDGERGWLECWASFIAEPYDEEATPFVGDAATARGFIADPGKGCESAMFGFLRRTTAIGIPDGWYWQCSCKTQYASVVSNAHFVTCHKVLVAMLDRAVRLGVDVMVHDETSYWETRDEARLIREVGSMNRLVAMMAGKIEIALGPDHRVEAPIFDHRRFERLEMGEWEEED